MLYKYLAPDRIDVLENHHIRFTQSVVFNDPFEIKPVISSIAPEDEARHKLNEMLPECLHKEYLKLPPEARSIMSFKQFLILAQMKLEKEMPNALALLDVFRPIVQAGISDFANKIGILSLTETPDNLLMWAHYASSHEGFVLGFDNQHPYFDCRKGPGDELHYLRKVKYVDQRPNLPMIELTGDDVLLTKSSQWAYENEWRILRPLQEADEVIEASPQSIHLFSFPPEMVREVILGYRISDELRSKITQVVKGDEKYHDVQVLQAKPDEQEFKVSFELVE